MTNENISNIKLNDSIDSQKVISKYGVIIGLSDNIIATEKGIKIGDTKEMFLINENS